LIENPNSVIFFEHKALYCSTSQTIPDYYYTAKIGEAEIKQSGNDLTIITYYGAAISEWITENCFEYLDAPIIRVDSLDTHVPFSRILGKNFLQKERVKEKLN